jgi:transcriptional regulator
MYNVPHFKASDQKEVIDFMHAHPFIILCGVDASNNPVATHIPCLIEERGDRVFLHAHVMRKQEHTKAFEQNPNVLTIFHGAHTYVSASWYDNKQTASTWNYQAVHAKGVLKFLGEEGLHEVISKLTEKFENNPHSPSLVQRMEDDYVKSMMKAIIAFEIEITEIQHIFKLSQNRDKKSYENIVERLSEQDADAQTIATTMRERGDKVFSSGKKTASSRSGN